MKGHLETNHNYERNSELLIYFEIPSYRFIGF